jgi:Papain fold toxin 1, glutamine deamidase
VLETDRSRDTPDTARDAPRPEETQVSADRGAVLADAPVRREYTLAYRATVDAVYARAALHPDGRQGGDSRAADSAEAKRPDMAERYPGRYTRPADPPPRVEGPGEHPSRWIGDIYPGRERNERPSNCGECARAADSTWHGAPAAAAELANRRVGGERPAVMAEWAGRPPEPASMADIGRRLCELGPGSSAVVGFDRADAPGHWFNAVNHQGTVLAVDAQAARFEKWPPSNDGLGFDEKGMSYSDAIYFTADGKVVPSDHQ